MIYATVCEFVWLSALICAELLNALVESQQSSGLMPKMWWTERPSDVPNIAFKPVLVT